MKFVLPGMGANALMYSGPWRRIKDSRFVDWPCYHNEQSISEVAVRLIEKYHLGSSDIMIGSSLGGCVGLEIANLVGVRKVYLVGSAMCADELSPLSKALMPLADRRVVKISQRAASFSKDGIPQMYAQSEPDFIVAMSKAIFCWPGYKGDRRRVARIHGRKDRFITCPSDCEIIDDGGHLIAVSHAARCVDFVCND
jgi:pimeloyl-ACP methyl ester carboxylesterase